MHGKLSIIKPEDAQEKKTSLAEPHQNHPDRSPLLRRKLYRRTQILIKPWLALVSALRLVYVSTFTEYEHKHK